MQKTSAEKITKLIEEFYGIAGARFSKRFTAYSCEVESIENFKDFWTATVIHAEIKETGKKVILLPYMALKNLSEKMKRMDKEILLHICLYHKRLLHEYGEVFLFHDELLYPTPIEILHSEEEKEKICDHFAESILKIV